MRRIPVAGPILLLGAGLFVPAPSAAQEPPAQEPPGQQEPTELVFQREVFTYPAYQRRNPFRPLVAGDEGGPRFEQLRVVGIIYSDDPAASVAIIGTSAVSMSPDGSQMTVTEGRSWYVKAGQTIGNIRIVEVRRDQVVVEVEEFGLTEQRIMQLQTRRLGGNP